MVEVGVLVSAVVDVVEVSISVGVLDVDVSVPSSVVEGCIGFCGCGEVGVSVSVVVLEWMY